MTYIVTTENVLSQVAPPNLPAPTEEYNRIFFEQFNNVLRLYFNQLNKIVSQLDTSTAGTVGSLLQFPNGAFYQDGVTTLTSSITNVSTTPILVADTSGFALSAGALIIGSEIITYTGKTSTSFTGITRSLMAQPKPPIRLVYM